MAALAGTTKTYTRKGLRESLSDFIYDITPMDTIMLSSFGVGPRSQAVTEEWQTDELRSPDGDNAVVEGNDATFAAPDPTVRVGNYHQISEETIMVSGTLEVVSKAGRSSELAREVTRKGRALKRDMETIIARSQGGDAGGPTTPRRLASLLAWVKTNTDHDAGGADPTWTSGVPTDARTDGAQRPLTETIFKNVLQLGWENGAEFANVLAGAYNKRVISGFSGIADRTVDLNSSDPGPMPVIGAADVYVDDFHTVRILPSRYQRARDVWFFGFDHVEIRYLRPFYVEKVAKTGDAEKRVMRAEWTLCAKNEKALGLAADLTTS